MVNFTIMQRPIADPFELQNQALEKHKEECVEKFGENVLTENNEPIYNSTLGK